jgi:DNA repair protein RecO (recombination protein O)
LSDFITLQGMVLSTMPIGDFDKRLVMLTRERGKITAFARGARKQNSPLLAGCNPFVFGEVSLFEGRSSYTLRSIEITKYFEELGQDLELMCYASYFAEFTDYYTRENIDGTLMLKLMYQALRALLNKSIPNPLVRLIFEMKTMVIGGDYSDRLPCAVCGDTKYTLEYIITSPVEKLYTFVVSDQVQKELRECVQAFQNMYIDRRFKSLEVLDTIL